MEFKYFQIIDKISCKEIIYKDKIKNLYFIIALIALGIFIFFVSIKIDSILMNIFFIAVGFFSIGSAIYLLMIQLNWRLKIAGKQLYIQNKYRKWIKINDINKIITEQCYTGYYGNQSRMFYHSKLVICDNSEKEKILLTSGTNLQIENHYIRHKEFIEIANLLCELIGCKLVAKNKITNATHDTRKTLY